MADYITVKNYSNIGEMKIYRKVFESIALDALHNVSGAKIIDKITNHKRVDKVLFAVYKPLRVSFRKSGAVDIDVDLKIINSSNPSDVCEKIQEEINNALITYLDSVPFSINLKIAGIE